MILIAAKMAMQIEILDAWRQDDLQITHPKDVMNALREFWFPNAVAAPPIQSSPANYPSALLCVSSRRSLPLVDLAERALVLCSSH